MLQKERLGEENLSTLERNFATFSNDIKYYQSIGYL